MSKLSILLIIDDNELCRFLISSLTLNEYNVIKTSSGKEAISHAINRCPDLILLDLDIIDTDGLEVLDNIRKWSEVPLIAISSRTQEKDKVKTLDLGADDYITKPLGLSELLARIRAILKRIQRINSPDKMDCYTFEAGGLNVDLTKRLVKINNKEVHLTSIEFKILSLLVRNVGRVLTYSDIMREVWGPYINERHILRVNIANIRKKIDGNNNDPMVQTIIGVGYRMKEE